jgi:hypothetical protein
MLLLNRQLSTFRLYQSMIGNQIGEATRQPK